MTQTILKSANDKNLYKALVLNNGLKVLLIQNHVDGEHVQRISESSEQSEGGDDGMDIDRASDAESDSEACGDSNIKMAAAALCVRVGSFLDPENLPGLAHFLEHMIFMGSKKYPEENYYDSFIQEHGGTDNAFTSAEKTVYQMEITPRHFKKALDIFANCIKDPLLNKDSMDRELESVDSEFQLTVSSDSERGNYILAQIAKKGSPLSKFLCGNKISLKETPEKNEINVNAALHEFHRSYYYAQNMTLAVQSTDTLETLECWVKEIFSDIPSSSVPLPNFKKFSDSFKVDAYYKLYKIIPVHNINRVYITWVLPPLMKYYKTKPIEYIAFCIGHEGRGSILSYLKKRCWATSLAAGNDGLGMHMNSCLFMFYLQLELTDEGMDHLHEVLTVVFQYMKLLRIYGPQEYIFKELQAVANNSFRFREMEYALDYVETLSEEMTLYPTEHYLTGTKLFFEYDPSIITKCINLLTADLANFQIFSKRYTEAECSEEEYWTKCKYSYNDVPHDLLDNWKNPADNLELSLPEPNKYIATNFDLKPAQSSENKYPINILDDGFGSVWFKEDRKFKIPKAYAILYFYMPIDNLQWAVLTDLFLEIYQNIVTEIAYPAAMAEFVHTIKNANDGFILLFSGFNDKLFLLVESVIDCIISLNPDEKLFKSLKEHLEKEYNNLMLSPNKLGNDLHSTAIRNLYWSLPEKYSALSSITLPIFLDFVKEFFSNFFLKSYYYGNLTKEDALNMHHVIERKMKIKPLSDKSVKIRITQMPVDTIICRVASFNKEDPNSFISNYYQLGSRSFKEYCFMMLFTHIMYEPCFDALRTHEQLGYDVNCIGTDTWGIYGILIVLQSPSNKFSAKFVDMRIDVFFTDFVTSFHKMSLEKFECKKNSFIQAKMCDDINMDEEVKRFWKEIKYFRYKFEWKEREIECLKTIQKDELTAWVENEFKDPLKRKKLSIQVVGPSDDLLKSTRKNSYNEQSKENVPINQNTLRYLRENSTENHFISDIGKFRNSTSYYIPYANQS